MREWFWTLWWSVCMARTKRHGLLFRRWDKWADYAKERRQCAAIRREYERRRGK